MRRVKWPIGLTPMRVTPLGGPKSLGYTESVTDTMQTVSQPNGSLRFQFDFPRLRGEMAAALAGLLMDLDDGASWVGAPCIYAITPGWQTLGIQPPPARGVPWSNLRPWSNGQNWTPARPRAVLAAAAATGATQIFVNVTAWGGTMWRGAPIGLPHFGAYFPASVRVGPGNVAAVRVWPPLRRAAASGSPVSLDPVLAGRLVPGTYSAGQRVGNGIEGASFVLREVRDDIVRAHTD